MMMMMLLKTKVKEGAPRSPMNLSIKLPWKSKNFKAKSKASLIVMKAIMMMVLFMMMKMGDELEIFWYNDTLFKSGYNYQTLEDLKRYLCHLMKIIMITMTIKMLRMGIIMMRMTIIVMRMRITMMRIKMIMMKTVIIMMLVFPLSSECRIVTLRHVANSVHSNL